MKKLYIVCLSLVLCLALTLTVSAGGGVSYNFDEVEVLYAAEFTAVPVSVQADQWFTSIAGGKDKPLEILYGVVALKEQGGTGGITEEFIKITGAGGSERFLSNSMTTIWRDPGKYTSLEYTKTQFWSAKQLDGTTVVKDFSKPIKSVILKKNFDSNKNLISIDIYFTNEGDKDAVNAFWNESNPADNYYRVDMSTLNQTGDAAIKR